MTLSGLFAVLFVVALYAVLIPLLVDDPLWVKSDRLLSKRIRLS